MLPQISDLRIDGKTAEEMIPLLVKQVNTLSQQVQLALMNIDAENITLDSGESLTLSLEDFYTKSATNSLLGGKSDTGHIHDDRYYTETEVNTLLSGKVSDTGDTMTGDLIAPTFATAKAKLNADGGLMIKLINKTGAATVKGEVVCPYSATAVNNAVKKILVDEPDPIGAFYESGIADGSEAWVVVSGIADVYFVGDAVRGHFARGFITGEASYVTGRVLSEAVPTSPFATDKHFYEIGHVLESRTGAGLAKCVLHFN